MEPLSPELQRLLDALGGEAYASLKDTGEVWPFGLGLTSAGKLAKFATKYYPDHTRERVIRDLTDILTDMIPKKDLIAVGIASKGTILNPDTGKETNAVVIHLEDNLGDCRRYGAPFSRGLFQNQWVWSPPFEQPAEPVFFPYISSTHSAPDTPAATPDNPHPTPYQLGEVLFLESEIPAIPWPAGYYVLCRLSETTATLAMVSEDAKGLYAIDNPYTIPIEDLPAFSRTGETARTSK